MWGRQGGVYATIAYAGSSLSIGWYFQEREMEDSVRVLNILTFFLMGFID